MKNYKKVKEKWKAKYLFEFKIWKNNCDMAVLSIFKANNKNNV